MKGKSNYNPQRRHFHYINKFPPLFQHEQNQYPIAQSTNIQILFFLIFTYLHIFVGMICYVFSKTNMIVNTLAHNRSRKYAIPIPLADQPAKLRNSWSRLSGASHKWFGLLIPV